MLSHFYLMVVYSDLWWLCSLWDSVHCRDSLNKSPTPKRVDDQSVISNISFFLVLSPPIFQHRVFQWWILHIRWPKWCFQKNRFIIFSILLSEFCFRWRHCISPTPETGPGFLVVQLCFITWNSLKNSQPENSRQKSNCSFTISTIDHCQLPPDI